MTITTAARRVTRWLNRHGEPGVIYLVRRDGHSVYPVATYAARLRPEAHAAGARLVRCSHGPDTYADVQRQLDDPAQIGEAGP